MQTLSTECRPSEEDYNAIEAAVMETARGRWFLSEYARRNRNADTEAVLSALRRLERLVQSMGSFEKHDEVSRGMADIARAIADAETSAGDQVSMEFLPEEEAEDDKPSSGENEAAGGFWTEDHVEPLPPLVPDAFPIIELDDDAAEALLSHAPARPEAIVPPGNLPASFAMARHGDAFSSAEALASMGNERVKTLPEETSIDLLTFIDEEPGEEGPSIFTAPLRLEPEDDVAEEAAEQRELQACRAENRSGGANGAFIATLPRRQLYAGPPMTLFEIEAMSFVKKATLFS